MKKYQLIIVGGGPGGYTAAFRAAELGMSVAIIDDNDLGGVCLNWGCIPTKALLKSAQVFEYINHANDYGITVGDVNADFSKIIKRSRDVADGMSKGISYLMKKNKIEVINGFGKVKPGNKISVTVEGKTSDYSSKHIIIATGARSRELPSLKQDGESIIGYREAMTLKKQPNNIVIVGSGAIGIEFAYFYNSMGTNVTVVEYMDRIVPVEDEEISKELEKSLKKKGINILTSSEVQNAKVLSQDSVEVEIKSKDGNVKTINTEIVLSAVGIKTNIENIGLEEVGIKTDKDKIIVDDFYMTNIKDYYAIGDVVKGQALAHVASAEGILCVEKITGHDVNPLDYNNVPGCTYCSPEIASVGYTEKQAVEKGYDVKIGKFPFSASGKAQASGKSEGFVKVIFDAKYGEWLGCHMIGEGVTDMIAEAVVGRKLETTGHEILKAVHPHPTMSEAVMEAVAAAYNEVIHL